MIAERLYLDENIHLNGTIPSEVQNLANLGEFDLVVSLPLLRL